MHKLFMDKSELFECDIKMEGASLSKSKARLVVETPDYSLLFNGTISSDGKCKIPIRELKGLIDENTSGNIRLEVIAEDTYFTPWESGFYLASKKVTVEVKTQPTKKPIIEASVEANVEVKTQPTKKPIIEDNIEVKVKSPKPTITEKGHVMNLLKLLIKGDINVDNISYKRNALNNIIATYLQENRVKNTGKVINGILQILEKEKGK